MDQQIKASNNNNIISDFNFSKRFWFWPVTHCRVTKNKRCFERMRCFHLQVYAVQTLSTEFGLLNTEDKETSKLSITIYQSSRCSIPQETNTHCYLIHKTEFTPDLGISINLTVSSILGRAGSFADNCIFQRIWWEKMLHIFCYPYVYLSEGTWWRLKTILLG